VLQNSIQYPSVQGAQVFEFEVHTEQRERRTDCQNA